MAKRLGIWAIFVLIVSLIVWGLIAANNKTGRVTLGELSIPVTAADWQTGVRDATSTAMATTTASSTVVKHTLVEYSDFQCPACASFHPVLKKLIAEHGDKFNFVYRHYPLVQVHQHAEAAAIAAEAAGKQGKFWEMHGMLFETQDVWVKASNPREVFVSYATQLGLDAKKFTADLDDKEIRTKITDQYIGGTKSGVRGTPSFYLDGKQIVNPTSYEAFVKLVAPKI